MIKAFLLLIIQNGLARLKPIYDRYIIRDVLSKGKELPAGRWFDIKFWESLSLSQLLAVGSLAAFKLVTFPLGVWIGSFSLVLTYPITHLIGNISAIIFHPIMLFIANKGLDEFVINTKTVIGLTIVMASLVLGAIGWYLIYVGSS